MAVLADSGLVAIHEDAVDAPRQWIAHFPDAASRARGERTLRQLQEARNVEIERIDVPDDDWARRTQADLPAIRVGRITVAPPWDVPTPGRLGPSGVLVIIEPSRGFGTGHHQSTRLCLTLLQARRLTGCSVVDVGTGSGVLAIAAAKLGAASVVALDFDDDAVENARENVARNHVDGVVTTLAGDFTKVGLAPADIVTANLTGALLVRHASDLVRVVNPTGSLIASGFDVEQREEVANAFAGAMAVVESAEEDGWWAYVLGRTAGR